VRELQARSSPELTDSNYTDGVSDNDSEDEVDLTQEPIHVGDEVVLVCDEEDGFTRGEVAVVMEAESPRSTSYPYHIKSQLRPEVHGFFELSDLKVVRRANHHASAVLGHVTMMV